MTKANFTKQFFSDESGGVTVDWVVLTAGIVGLSVAVLVSIGGGVMDNAETVEAQLDILSDELSPN